MSHHKPHSTANIPFSWENKPGISKVIPHQEKEKNSPSRAYAKLPPPPGQVDCRKVSVHGLYLPLPPSTFQAPARSLSRRGSKKEDDPFLVAYIECTKGAAVRGKGKTTRKKLWLFSCKDSSDVVENTMVRLQRVFVGRPGSNLESV